MENEKKCTEDKGLKEPQIHVETDEEYAQRVSEINMQGIEEEN